MNDRPPAASRSPVHDRQVLAELRGIRRGIWWLFWLQVLFFVGGPIVAFAMMQFATSFVDVLIPTPK